MRQSIVQISKDTRSYRLSSYPSSEFQCLQIKNLAASMLPLLYSFNFILFLIRKWCCKYRLGNISLRAQKENYWKYRGKYWKLSEIIGNYRKISAKINLDLKNSENIRQISNLKNREKSKNFATLDQCLQQSLSGKESIIKIVWDNNDNRTMPDTLKFDIEKSWQIITHMNICFFVVITLTK